MKTIHKASVGLDELDDVVILSLPRDAKILSVGNQNERLCLWYETTDGPERDKQDRPFRVAGTGHPLGDGLGRFLGTVLFADGKLVFHVYEIKESRG